jgi:L-malate glycosyltransferase
VPRGRPYPIAFFLTSFDVGGTERQMVELVRRLDRREFEVHLACFHRRGALEREATELAASVAQFPIEGFGRWTTARQALAFARWCRRIDARIVHTCELYANIFGLPAAALAGVPVRIGNRRELLTPDKTRALLASQRAAYRTAHAVVANSAAAAGQLTREGIAAPKVSTIPNGVDCEAFAPADRGRHRIRRVVTVANLRPEKGHDTLLDAWPSIAAACPGASLDIVGDGPLRPALVARVEAAGLSGRVRFLGERRDVPSVLAASDLFVLASRSEACPNAVLEAMAAGMPIVATGVGGVPELIASGRTGVLVEPDAPRALADAVTDLIARPQAAFALGAAARQAAVQRFSFERMVARFERLYLSTLQRRAVGREHGTELAAS